VNQPHSGILLPREIFKSRLVAASASPRPADSSAYQHPAVLIRVGYRRFGDFRPQRNHADRKVASQIESGLDQGIDQQVPLQVVSNQDEVTFAQVDDQSPQAGLHRFRGFEKLFQGTRGNVIKDDRQRIFVWERLSNSQYPAITAAGFSFNRMLCNSSRLLKLALDFSVLPDRPVASQTCSTWCPAASSPILSWTERTAFPLTTSSLSRGGSCVTNRIFMKTAPKLSAPATGMLPDR
jgi:hypothetical protein